MALAFTAGAATLPADWQYEQPFNVAAPGLVKIDLPIETLDAARPALEDLRLYDDAGGEVPYLIEHPVPALRIIRGAKSFQTSLNAQNTIITLETGLAQPINSVLLETPANNFIKAVSIEGSSDGQTWRNIAQGKPIFRQPNGASELSVEIPPAVWAWLRLTVDDQRSPPIPFTGARVQAAAGASAPDEALPVRMGERLESPGETRLSLNLGAANLTLSQLQIETGEPLFTRQVTLAVPQILEDSIREQPIGGGVIYRLTIEGQPASANLSISLETQVRSRELLMLIRNNDSPPLPITAVRALRRPVYLVFLAKQTGAHYLLAGNAHCAAPRYDLAALAANLKSIAVAPVPFSSFTTNSAYHPPEVLADVQDNGTALDISAWPFREPLKIARPGAQQLELDLNVLSHAQSGLADLRLMRDGKQIPYIVERTSIQRALTPAVTATNDVRDPKISRWILKLSDPGLPVTRLVCASRTPLFQRQMTAYEELRDERGETYQHSLGSASWLQTPDAAAKEFTLGLDGQPRGDSIILETQNGDNLPIALEKFQLFYPATRILFKAKADDALFLYYGNPEASAPRYDLSLVANELLAADKSVASPGAEQALKKSPWRGKGAAGRGGVLFWGILALVVVVLLAVISRLLPKSEPQPPK